MAENPMVVRCQVVWVVGEKFGDDRHSWGLMGIFNTEDEALEICPGKRFFIGPVPFGVALPEGHVEWPGAYYPEL